MNRAIVIGDPEQVASFCNNLISSGNEINAVEKLNFNAQYVILYTGTGPIVGNFLLMEDSGFILLETGDKILLEA